MSKPKIYNGNEFLKAIENTDFKKPSDFGPGGKIAYAHAKGNERDMVYIKLCNENDERRLKLPFGISKPYDLSKIETQRKSVNIQINDPKLIDSIHKSETLLCSLLSERSQQPDNSWFGKMKHTPATVRNLMTSVITQNDPTYLPCIRTKMNTEGIFTAGLIFVGSDKKYRKGTIEDIKPSCEVVPVIRFAGIWFVSNKWGISLEISHMLIFKPAETTSMDMFDMSGFTADTPDNTADTPDATEFDEDRAAQAAAEVAEAEAEASKNETENLTFSLSEEILS